MYALFLETEAAEEIDRYVAANGGDAEDIKQRCYKNAKEQYEEHHASFDDWIVRQCLNDDLHETLNVDDLFIWRDTPEGHEYWAKIANW